MISLDAISTQVLPTFVSAAHENVNDLVMSVLYHLLTASIRASMHWYLLAAGQDHCTILLQ